MTDDFTIQCKNCGFNYDDLEDACPQCGHRRPPLPEQASADTIPVQPFTGEQIDDQNYQDEAYYDEQHPHPDDEYQVDEDYYPEDEHYYLEEDEGEYYPEDDYPYDAEPYPEENYEQSYQSETASYPQHQSRPYTPYAEDEVGDYSYEQSYQEMPPPQPTGWAGMSMWVRLLVMVLGLSLCFICTGIYFGGIGLKAISDGFEEQMAENNSHVEERYQKGLTYLEDGNYERAIPEFEYVLSFDGDHAEAKVALRRAQAMVEEQPTSTPPSYPDATENLWTQAQNQVADRQWAEAIRTLTQLRNLDLSYQTDRVSEMLYTANYQLGLQQLAPEFVEEAVNSFQRALEERPGDPRVQAEYVKANAYLKANTTTDKQEIVEQFKELYQQDATYLDVEARMVKAYTLWGDELALAGDWCNAELQYGQALILQPNDTVRTKADNMGSKCISENGTLVATPTETLENETLLDEQPVPTETSTVEEIEATPTTEPEETESFASALDITIETEATITTTETSTAETTPEEETAPNNNAPTTPSGGTILYTAFNKDEDQWHILSVPASGGSPKFVARHGIQPTISNDGRFMLYQSTIGEALGLHEFDFHTGNIRRVTILAQDQLPAFGADSGQFLFNAQEPATKRWQVHQGVTSGLSDPKIIVDGRTPAWSTDGSVAYQTTTPDGNNPGIYVAGFVGAMGERITMHESDRSPDFSPDGSQITYMSTQNGNWDIYVVNRDSGEPRQITTYPGNDGLPVWSPDGSQIAYVSDEGGLWAIYVINAAGGTPTKVTNWSSLERVDWLMSRIAWSPNP